MEDEMRKLLLTVIVMTLALPAVVEAKHRTHVRITKALRGTSHRINSGYSNSTDGNAL